MSDCTSLSLPRDNESSSLSEESPQKIRYLLLSHSAMEDSWELWMSHLDDNSFNPFVDIDENRGNSTQQPTLSSKTVTQTHSLYPSLESQGYSKEMTMAGNINIEHRVNQGTKRTRVSSVTQGHIMTERKRRQEMAERFIALSAIIPGLKKIDKASVLGEAINYVKHLQERIAVLGQESKKKGTKSMIFTKKFRLCDETNSNNCHGFNQMLPEVEAIGLELEKEVLIRIHCEKRNGIFSKLLSLLGNIHLSVARSSVLPFGNNTLNITIIAQMGDKCSMTVNELVKNLRQDLLKLYDMQL